MQPATPFLEAAVEHGVLVLRVLHRQIQGEDIAAGLKDELEGIVRQYNAKQVVLDLSRCCYVSSIAFWPLLSLRKRLSEAGGRLIVCGLSGMVLDVFTNTKMVSNGGNTAALFEMAPDRDTAVARLAHPAL
ncbi:MAG: STAS domain-containing protein [Gemmataceae bacterium]